MSSDGKVKYVLDQAGKDLDNAQLPGVVNWAFVPVRDLLLSPVVYTAAKITPTIPIVDDISAFFLNIPFNFARTVYGVLPERKDKDYGSGFHRAVENEADTEEMRLVTVRGLQERPSGFLSNIKSVFGFGINTLVDFVSAPGQKVSKWNLIVVQFLGYLLYSGIDKEIADTLLNPNAISNIQIISRVQVENREKRRVEAAASQPNVPVDKFAHFYMKYATAAYGISVMQSAEALMKFDPRPSGSIFDGIKRSIQKAISFVGGSWDKTNKEKIAKYVNIDTDDIKYITPLYVGGSTDILRHFVAVDGKRKAVVLAIRGTYTVSGLVTDLNSTSVPFCGGLAHKGFAEMANSILASEGDTMNAIKDALKEHPKYELIVTGHSLGAGVACLVNIKIHYDELFQDQGTKIRCFAYAPPPSYATKLGDTNYKNSRIIQAITNTTSYIHCDDCVPFLGIEPVCRLMDMIGGLDLVDSSLNWFQQKCMAAGRMEPTQPIINYVNNADNSEAPRPSQPDAKRLYIASENVWWIYESKDESEGFKSQFSIPEKIAALSILMSTYMIADHMPAQYEKALYAVKRSTIKTNGDP